jgi:hypothetical protein
MYSAVLTYRRRTSGARSLVELSYLVGTLVPAPAPAAILRSTVRLLSNIKPAERSADENPEPAIIHVLDAAMMALVVVHVMLLARYVQQNLST